MTPNPFRMLLSAAYAAARGDAGVHAELGGAVPLGWTYRYVDRRFYVHGYYVNHPAASFFAFLTFMAYGDFAAWRLLDQMGDRYCYEIVSANKEATCAFVIIVTLSPTTEVKQTYQGWRLRMISSARYAQARNRGGGRNPQQLRAAKSAVPDPATLPSEIAQRKAAARGPEPDSFEMSLAHAASAQNAPPETSSRAVAPMEAAAPSTQRSGEAWSAGLPVGWSWHVTPERHIVRGRFIEVPHSTFCGVLRRVELGELGAWRRVVHGPEEQSYEILSSSADREGAILVELTLSRTDDPEQELPRFRSTLGRADTKALLNRGRKV
jgi:hypothetical protein